MLYPPRILSIRISSISMRISSDSMRISSISMPNSGCYMFPPKNIALFCGPSIGLTVSKIRPIMEFGIIGICPSYYEEVKGFTPIWQNPLLNPDRAVYRCTTKFSSGTSTGTTCRGTKF